MGRELKRVPLDFAWPLKKTWGGYLNPHYSQRTDCPECKGSGYADRARLFADQWYGNQPFNPQEYGATPIAIDSPTLVGFATRQVERSPEFYGSGPSAVLRNCRRLYELFRGQWCHHLIQADVDALLAEGRLHTLRQSGNDRPKPADVNEWSVDGFGHDAINRMICVRARCEREGADVDCSRCGGDGDMWTSEKAKADCENWEPTEPPVGAGFQLWETTSEGSPVSPVFSTIEALCEWCADNATTFGSHKASADKWRQMLDDNFVAHVDGNMVFA